MKGGYLVSTPVNSNLFFFVFAFSGLTSTGGIRFELRDTQNYRVTNTNTTNETPTSIVYLKVSNPFLDDANRALADKISNCSRFR